LTALDGQDRQVSALGIGADVMLINVYSAFHQCSPDFRLRDS
jgi:hypothetical protein